MKTVVTVFLTQRRSHFQMENLRLEVIDTSKTYFIRI